MLFFSVQRYLLLHPGAVEFLHFGSGISRALPGAKFAMPAIEVSAID
jgi:hypothetical protein